MRVNSRRTQRRNERAAYSICWQDRSNQMKSAEVQSVDLSNSGIGINCAVEIPPGTTVYIESKNGPLRGYSTVRHCIAPGYDIRDWS